MLLKGAYTLASLQCEGRSSAGHSDKGPEGKKVNKQIKNYINKWKPFDSCLLRWLRLEHPHMPTVLLWLCSGFQVMNMHYCACMSFEDRKQIVWRFGYPVLMLPLATGSLQSGIQWIPKQRNECGETEERCSISITATVLHLKFECRATFQWIKLWICCKCVLFDNINDLQFLYILYELNSF